MLQELQDPTVETGLTNQLIEDIPPFREHQFIMQARTFLKNGTNPVMYYAAVARSLPQVIGVEHKTAMQLLTDIELVFINIVAKELDAANQTRKDGDTKATKPRELYVRYAPTLEQIIARGTTDPMQLYRTKRDSLPLEEQGTIKPPVSKEAILTTTAMQARSVFQDLYTSTSLSENDLVNPVYLDPYTGQIEYETVEEFARSLPEQHDITGENGDIRALLRHIELCPDEEAATTSTAISNNHKEALKWAIETKNALGWDDETMEQFINTQLSGYDSESDDIPLQDDDIDPYTPPTLIPNDLVLDRELWYSAREDVSAFNKARSEIFDAMQADNFRRRKWRKRFKEMKRDTKWRKYWYQKYWELRRKARKNTWHIIFRKRFTQREEFARMVDAIHNVAREDLVTAATIYLSLAGDYGVMEGDVQHIRGLYQLPEQFYKPEQITPGVYIPLVNFANEWEDDLLNLSQDALSKSSDTNPHAYQDVLMDVITTDENGEIQVSPAPIRATMPKYDNNPINTASWNIGFARAAAAKTTWQQAEDAGWAAWRQEMSGEAAAAYDRVYAETKDRKKAMAAFWAVAPREVPRPKDQIAVIKADKSGLKLTNGRQISWNIAKMKIEKDELFLTPDIRKRLLAALQQNKCGQQIWALLK